MEARPWQGNRNCCCNAPKKIYLTKICGTYIETAALGTIDNQIVRKWAGVFSSTYDRVGRHFKRHSCMTNAFFRKVITLLSSLSLVTLFLLYRVGTFDTLNNLPALQSSHNGGSINQSTIDTTKLKKDSNKPMMLPSSKVIILTDKKPTIIDSLEKKPAKNKYTKGESEILSSSKSAIIFKPEKTTKNNPDSFNLKRDTLKPEKKKE